ncbi:Inositol monophosphatase 3 [Tupaia chinensis]|uniref:Golgi-resident adenosine 3',5'-bisphosphate 3'-phosphatase n=1 Tax=Tupaia chinensis TaxID=246437 RepID=L9LA37_TUPCH|nr:Inositol monophosphatase 3 [Tupaia chinensis]
MTSGDVLSNRKMFYLLKTAFPSVQPQAVGASDSHFADVEIEAQKLGCAKVCKQFVEELHVEIEAQKLGCAKVCKQFVEELRECARHLAQDHALWPLLGRVCGCASGIRTPGFWVNFDTKRINTEEHVDATDQEVILWDRKIPEDILKEISTPKEVPAESVTVWIDPLDATQEYTEDLRKYVTTMVCVAVNGKPVLGVIHKPFSEYTGYKVLALLDVPDKSQEKADLYIHVTYIKKWDICAGNAILKALGGHMTTLNGEEISYTGSDGIEGGLLASIRMNHQALPVCPLPALIPIALKIGAEITVEPNWCTVPGERADLAEV